MRAEAAADNRAYSIRHAQVEDATELARLCAQLGYPAEAAQVEARLERMLDLPTHAVFVLAGDEGLAGFVAIEHRLSLEAGERGELVALVVDAAARGQGCGRSLVSAAELWALRRGLPEVLVRSNVLRDAAHPFYERLGYARTKTQHAYARPLGAAWPPDPA